MMKSKRADMLNWSRVPKKRFVMKHIQSSGFTGYISLLSLDKVLEPLWVKRGEEEICLADNGYTWLQQFPHGTHYTVTTSFDAQGTLVRFYIDICKRHYLDTQGMLWYDDLYLDLDISLNGEIKLLDVDELDEALQTGDVTSLEYELAWREVNSLMTAIEEDMFPLLWMSDIHREILMKNP